MRILFVTPYLPSIMRVRPFNFIKHLSDRHEVTLISLTQGDQSDADALHELTRFCSGVYTLELNKLKSFANCCRRLLTPMPLQAAYTDMPLAKELVRQIADSRPFDLLHVEHIRGAHLAEQVTHIPKVFDAVDCITRLLKLRLNHEKSVFHRAVSAQELLKMKSYEPKTASLFDNIVITSRRDKRALEALMRSYANGNGCKSSVTVVPNGVDCDYFQPSPNGKSSTIVFCGRMSYFANSSAAYRFYHEAFPYIKRVCPDARFRIVGSDPPDSIRKLAEDPSVEVTGYVPDIRPHLASAALAVCPLIVGVGIQNKVLEAMAMGKPVVATEVACKGIPEIVDGEHFIKADDPIRTAGAAILLLDNPEYARRLGEHARRFAEDRYSWKSAVRQLEGIHLQAAGIGKERIPAAA